MTELLGPILAAGIEEYAEQSTTEPSPLLAEVERHTRAAEPDALMLSGRVVGRLLTMLAAVLRPKLAVDIGTFTGYSAISIAEGLPAGSRVVTCEADPARAEVARGFFEKGPHGDKIDLHVGPALATLGDSREPIGLAFIDGEKTEYWAYYEAVLGRLTPEGLIVVDNTLFFGSVLVGDAAAKELPLAVRRNRAAILKFNQRLRDDARSETCLLTVRDGLTLIRRRR